LAFGLVQLVARSGHGIQLCGNLGHHRLQQGASAERVSPAWAADTVPANRPRRILQAGPLANPAADYNEVAPHSALAMLAPATFYRQRLTKSAPQTTKTCPVLNCVTAQHAKNITSARCSAER
jgi:hypothetical protein